jgi:hypothetical protein
MHNTSSSSNGRVLYAQGVRRVLYAQHKQQQQWGGVLLAQSLHSTGAGAACWSCSSFN